MPSWCSTLAGIGFGGRRHRQIPSKYMLLVMKGVILVNVFNLNLHLNGQKIPIDQFLSSRQMKYFQPQNVI